MADRQAKKLQSACALHAAGDLQGAERLFRQVLAVLPAQPEATCMLSEVLADQGRFEEAVQLLQRLAAAQPKLAAAQYSLGNVHRLAGQLGAAIAAYQAALALNPLLGEAHHGRGLALRQAEQEQAALEHFRQAARLLPTQAVVWKDLGLALAVLGELRMAEAALDRAVSLQPTLGEAQRHLAALRQAPAGPAEIAALSARAGDARTPLTERIELGFTLGRLLDKAENYDAAFGHFAAANRRQREAKPGFDRARLTADIDNIISVFTPATLRRFAGGDPSERPVFMVGMPRSGSSLFEQIAASHPGVFGAGERTGIGAVAQRLGWAPSPAWSPAALAAEASGYLSEFPPEPVRIIDKMPDNIFQLGLIAALFPNARVIFCERDPRDLGLSCFFQHFTQPLGYDTDLADIAFRIRELERLKAHWRQVLKLNCLSLSYENLLAEPEAQSRRLIAFLGLDWDPACLDFHRTGRIVRTASWAQVRQPLYSRSAGQWRRYAAHIAPLLEAFPAQSEA